MALLLLAATVAAACGGGGGLPDLGACPPPDAARPTPDRVPPEFVYANAVLDGISEIDERARSFHREWPDRDLEDSDRFREDFNEYEFEARCQAEALAALEPFPEAAEFDATFDAALARYRDVMADGRDAVRQRNVSEFRRWDDREASAVTDIVDLPGELFAVMDEITR